MRYSPAHAAKSGSVPFMLRGPKSVRTALSAAVAGVIGLMPAVLVSSPASAAAGDYTVSSVAAAEGGNITFTVVRTGGAVDASPGITWSTAEDLAATHPAKANLDFTPATGSLAFVADAGAGTNQTLTFTVPTLADDLDEDAETFKINFSKGGSPLTVSGSVNGTINDDPNDLAPSYTLSAAPATVAEAGTAPATVTTRVTATLAAASGKDVAIALNSTNGTAIAPGDYTSIPANTTINIAAGQTSGYYDVTVNADGVKDSATSESFTVTGVGGAGTVNPTTQTTTINITDQDPTPKVTLTGGASQVEGTPITFTVSLDRPSDKSISVQWDAVAAAVVAGHGTATPGTDFTYPSARTITFNPGEVSKTLSIATTVDSTDEDDPEDFAVELSSPTNADLGSPVKVPTAIVDSVGDLPPTVTITPIAVDEGNSGKSTKTFKATLSKASGRSIKLDWTTAAQNTGLTYAVAGKDYVDNKGTLTFPAGSTEQTFTVDILGDTVDEGTGETFYINPSQTGTSTATFAAHTTVTITDDDDKPTFTFGDVVYKETNGVVAGLLPIKLAGTTSDRPLSFDITNTNTLDDIADSGSTYLGGNDYTLIGAPAQEVVVPAEMTTGYGVVLVNGDEVYESTETAHFTATPQAGQGTYLGGSAVQAKATIQDDDKAPNLEINSITGKEGDTVDVTGTVTGVAQQDVWVNVSFAGGSSKGSKAADASDFTNPGVRLVSIDGGQATGSIIDVAKIPLLTDTTAEPAETIIATGTGLNNIGTVTEGIVTIAANGTTTPTDPTDPDAPTLKASASTILGAGSVTLSGVAGDGADVQLWGRTVNSDEGDFEQIDETTASGSGAFSFKPGLSTDGMYFKVSSDDMESDEVRVYVKEDPELAATSTSKGVVRLVVTGDPKVRGLGARVFRQNANGSWTLVGSGILNASGTFTKVLTGQASGKSFTYKSYVVGDAERGVLTNWSSYSRTVRVK
jgi:hypothetical protein